MLSSSAAPQVLQGPAVDWFVLVSHQIQERLCLGSNRSCNHHIHIQRKNTALKTTQETFQKFYPSLSSPVYEEREKNENMHLSTWLYYRQERYYILNIY